MFTDRTNTAQWIESEKRWKIKVQRDGVRKCFTSSTRGRMGQREANAKADAWLRGELVERNKRLRVADAIDLYERYLAELEAIRRGETLSPTQKITGRMLGNSRPAISLLRTWLEPYKRKWLDTIGDAEVQTVLDKAAAAGRSKKTIQDLRAAILALIKHHRRRGATSYRPDDISISPAARLKGKNILQPIAIKKLFESDQTILNGKQCFDDLIYAYRFQVLTGFRPGELIGLKWEDVDLQNGIIHLQRSINVYGNETQGKNENAIRDFALHKNARNVLIAQRLASGRSTGYVFKIYA